MAASRLLQCGPPLPAGVEQETLPGEVPVGLAEEERVALGLAVQAVDDRPRGLPTAQCGEQLAGFVPVEPLHLDVVDRIGAPEIV